MPKEQINFLKYNNKSNLNKSNKSKFPSINNLNNIPRAKIINSTTYTKLLLKKQQRVHKKFKKIVKKLNKGKNNSNINKSSHTYMNNKIDNMKINLNDDEIYLINEMLHIRLKDIDIYNIIMCRQENIKNQNFKNVDTFIKSMIQQKEKDLLKQESIERLYSNDIYAKNFLKNKSCYNDIKKLKSKMGIKHIKINSRSLIDKIIEESTPNINISFDKRINSIFSSVSDDSKITKDLNTENTLDNLEDILSDIQPIQNFELSQKIGKKLYDMNQLLNNNKTLLKTKTLINSKFYKLLSLIKNNKSFINLNKIRNYIITLKSKILARKNSKKSIAHRGCLRLAPENTIPSYQKANELGYKYVETDVTFTKDSIPMLLHDSKINRTSNGRGKLSSMTYQKAISYDFGHWKNNDFKDTKIPTFIEFIKFCKENDLYPYIELKSSGKYNKEKIKYLMDIVNSFDMKDHVVWVSFSMKFLQMVKEQDKKATLGLLALKLSTNKKFKDALNLKTSENKVFLDTMDSLLSTREIEKCKRLNIPLEVWALKHNVENKKFDEYITGVTNNPENQLNN